MFEKGSEALYSLCPSSPNLFLLWFEITASYSGEVNTSQDLHLEGANQLCQELHVQNLCVIFPVFGRACRHSFHEYYLGLDSLNEWLQPKCGLLIIICMCRIFRL